jgi:type IV pilus assembly protein PilF
MNKPAHLGSESRRTLSSLKTPLLLLIASLVIVSGCASSQSDDSINESKSRKAAESNTSLGLEYMERGQYEVALGKLKKAIKEDPDYAPAHTVIAVLYERIGEIELAGRHYQKAYEADPKNGDVNNNYGVYLCKSGKGKNAIDHFLNALDDPFYSSPSVALTNAGSCAMRLGDLINANDYLRQALKIEPEFPDALMAMARLNFEKESYLTARAFMQRYEAVTNHNADSLLLAYKIESASGDLKAAKKYKLTLETNFPKSDQTAEVRRMTGK